MCNNRILLAVLPLLFVAYASGVARATDRHPQVVALAPYGGTYTGQWRLLNFSDIPYVELNEYLAERDFGKQDTLLVEPQNDSTLIIRLQNDGILLNVIHYKAFVRETSTNEELYFRAIPNDDGLAFHYRSVDGRLQLSFRVVGGAGGYSFLGPSGYSEGDGCLRMPKGELDAQAVVECVGTFDGHALRMKANLRLILRRERTAQPVITSEPMDARCRGCI